MKLKAFFVITIVLFSGIAMNLGHEETASVTFLSPEEYDIVSGGYEVKANVAGRVDGNYFLENVVFSYSENRIDWIEIENYYVGLGPGRGEDVSLMECNATWDTTGLDGKYYLRGIANYTYSSPLADSEPSEDTTPSNGNGKGKYSQFLSGLSFLKYDFKYGSSGSGKPESPGEMKDSKEKPAVDIIVYVSNEGGLKPDFTKLIVSDLDNSLLLRAGVNDPFDDLVTGVGFEYRYLDGGTWKNIASTSETLNGDYICFWDTLGLTGTYKVRAYLLNANGDIIGIQDDKLILTDAVVPETILIKSSNITLPLN